MSCVISNKHVPVSSTQININWNFTDCVDCSICIFGENVKSQSAYFFIAYQQNRNYCVLLTEQ